MVSMSNILLYNNILIPKWIINIFNLFDSTLRLVRVFIMMQYYGAIIILLINLICNKCIGIKNIELK